MTRNQILDLLVTQFASLGQVYRRFKYLDEIHDFPTICFTVEKENRVHIGAGVKYGGILLQMRVIVKQEDPIQALEDLITNIETICEAMPSVDDCKIVSIETDEGLLTPIGTAIIRIYILYQI